MNKPFYKFIARNIETGETIELCGAQNMKDNGFRPAQVYETADGFHSHHRGYTFVRVALSPEERSLKK